MPPALSAPPYSAVLDVARTAGFTAAEWEAYDQAKMAEQDARGATIVAHMEGRQEGLKEGRKEGLKEGIEQGLRGTIIDLCEVLGISLDDARRAAIEAMSGDDLLALRERLKRDRRF